MEIVTSRAAWRLLLVKLHRDRYLWNCMETVISRTIWRLLLGNFMGTVIRETAWDC